MKGINIDESNKLIINPMQIDANKFKVEEAKTQAPAVQEFTYVEPVEFGTGCFGNPEAFNRLQEIIHQRENIEQGMQQEETLAQELPAETANTLETNFTLETDAGVEPAFC